jgi:hypothetical protein
MLTGCRYLKAHRSVRFGVDYSLRNAIPKHLILRNLLVGWRDVADQIPWRGENQRRNQAKQNYKQKFFCKHNYYPFLPL